MIATLDDDIQYVAQTAGEDYISELELPAAATDELFGQVFDRAVEYARDHSAELVSGIDDSTRDMLASEIADSLEAGESLDETIDRIQDVYAFSDDRAELIARTEIGDANQHGALESMRAAEDYGLEVEKYWSANNDPCDDCQENEDASPIPLGDTFPSGDDAPLAHPHCECSLISVISYPGGEEVEEESDDEE